MVFLLDTNSESAERARWENARIRYLDRILKEKRLAAIQRARRVRRARRAQREQRPDNGYSCERNIIFS